MNNTQVKSMQLNISHTVNKLGRIAAAIDEIIGLDYRFYIDDKNRACYFWYDWVPATNYRVSLHITVDEPRPDCGGHVTLEFHHPMITVDGLADNDDNKHRTIKHFDINQPDLAQRILYLIAPCYPTPNNRNFLLNIAC